MYSSKELVPDDKTYVYRSDGYHKTDLAHALEQIDRDEQHKYFRVEGRSLIPVAPIHPHTRITKTGKTQKVRGHWRVIPEKVEELDEEENIEETECEECEEEPGDEDMDEYEDYVDIIENFRKQYKECCSEEEAEPPERGERKECKPFSYEEIEEKNDEFEIECREELEEITETPPEVEDIDNIAWYTPYHFQNKWGIFARYDAVKDLAMSMVSRLDYDYVYNNVDAGVFPSKKAFNKIFGKVVFNEILASILRHEIFHHMAEVTATSYEIILNRPMYLEYWDNVYSPSYRTANNVEEALATLNQVFAFSSDGFIEKYYENSMPISKQYAAILNPKTKFLETLDQKVRETWLDKAPFSYNRYIDYYSDWKKFIKGIRILNSQIYNMDLNSKNVKLIEIASGQLFNSPEIMATRGGPFSDIFYKHFDFFTFVKERDKEIMDFPIPLYFV